jgi:hypothetical protein
MANTVRVNGFRPVKHLNGSPYNGQTNIYFAAGTMYVGDLVKLSGTSDPSGSAPSIVVSTAAGDTATGDASVGVVVGKVVTKLDPVTGKLSTGSMALDTPQAIAANDYVLVADADDILFEAQEDAVGGAMAITDVGQNVNFVDGGGSSTTGASGMQVDTSTKAGTANLVLKIRGFVNRPDNEVGVANAKVLVSINKHQLGQGTGTAGV